MSHWLLDSLGKRRDEALAAADRIQVYQELFQKPVDVDLDNIRAIADALELAILDLLHEPPPGEADIHLATLRQCAADAFRLYRGLPLPGKPLDDAVMLLRMSALAILGDKGADAARELRKRDWHNPPPERQNWGEHTWWVIVDIWLRLIRKKGWEDRDSVLEQIAGLRETQKDYEKNYLENKTPAEAKGAALELISLYHLGKAAEILALYITDGVVEGNFQIRQLLETHFDRALAACEHARMYILEPLTFLLAAAARQMADNCIWTVTRAVNSRVTQFVKTITDRGRGDRAIFDVLPPQRRVLAEKGLLGSSRRAVVVSLPTSSGKTLIAQFRILQALNQFDAEKGWVAYLAPVKSLVNQAARQFRHDFAPLGISVERLSPALEMDNIEISLLQERDNNRLFRILATTPEKLDLMLRQGWEEKIGRPLTLVVADEAHNIQNSQHGLKLELLLSTINKECKHAQFLLLTPFIQNAAEIARWLDAQNSDDISLALDWQPNDRVIGIVHPVKGEKIKGNSFKYSLDFKSVHTTRKTISFPESLSFPGSEKIAPTFSSASEKTKVAALAALKLSDRGPVIAMHSRPDWVWDLAKQIKSGLNRLEKVSGDIRLLQDYLRIELGAEFPLTELLDFGIGVHHEGLPDDVRLQTEKLFAKNELKFLCATTTIAQGVNFPVSGVVMASHQYPYGKDMPPEDFWNIAGRVGRISQGQLGVIALASKNQDDYHTLETFISKQTGNLNSALINMALEAKDAIDDLKAIVYTRPEWSSFLQYLAHTYRQMGKPDSFFAEIEQVLRGTLGFETLRKQDKKTANRLLLGIEKYVAYLREPNQPLKLVDSTGFSLQSIKDVLAKKNSVSEDSWNRNSLFKAENPALKDMMGVLLMVPELKNNLKDVTGGDTPDGQKLSLIIKDWVNGETLPEIAERYFKEKKKDRTTALTKCGQKLFGDITQTVSWGLGALLSITASHLPEEQFRMLRNLPSWVYYGVNSDGAAAMRLLGAPRSAAAPLADFLGDNIKKPLPELRSHLTRLTTPEWKKALGNHGEIYQKVWKITEGLE